MANGAVNYRSIDAKVGIGPGGPAGNIGSKGMWQAGAAYNVGDTVQNGGFMYRCTVAGNAAAAGVGPSPKVLVDNTVTWAVARSASDLTQADAVPQHEVGYELLAKDQGPNAYGVGEFQYLQSSGGCTAGDFCSIDRGTGKATQLAAGAKGSVGIAMGTLADGQYGYFMVRGIHDQANTANAVAAGGMFATSGTAGQVAASGGAGARVDSAYERVRASVAGSGTVELYWPGCNGNT